MPNRPHLSFCSEPSCQGQRTLRIASAPQGTRQFIVFMGSVPARSDRPRQSNNLTSIMGSSPRWMYPDSRRSRAKSPLRPLLLRTIRPGAVHPGDCYGTPGNKVIYCLNEERACSARQAEAKQQLLRVSH